ncbi:MAG: protein kinase [Verrucomicrobiales bacterium]
MSDANTNLEELIFEAAIAKDTPEERAAFVDSVCREDAYLRSRIELLLEGYFEGEGFLTQTPERENLPEPVTPTPVPPAEPPTSTIGRYKLLEKIGEGGFGEVWMAEQRQPVKRRVALKIIKLGMDSKQVVARFEAERQALAMMDHPNIAKILDADIAENGRPYFVMELVRGIKITDYCDKSRLSAKERLELFISVCQAIQHAHQKGIIHRDIKPSNIIVTLHDGVPVPKVIDFGIAKAMQQELTDKTLFTQFQQFVGTPAYISPEQAEMSGLDIDTRADIYSLGVLLYELLIGQTPFDPSEMVKDGIDALRKIIQEKEPTRPSNKLSTLAGEARDTAGKTRQTEVESLVHQLRGDLDWIVMKCLEKDRKRRYDSASGLAADLQRHLNHEPIVARPPSTAYKLQKAWQRNKLAYLSAAVVALALFFGAGVASWQAFEAKQAKNKADANFDKAEANRKDAVARQVEAEAAKEVATKAEEQAQKLLYSANMNLIQAAFEQENYLVVQRLLKETADHPDRGFEWYYWQRKMHSELSAVRAHSVRIPALAFSPDSRQVASGDEAGVVNIWDRVSGKVAITFTVNESVADLEFSPDGEKLLVTEGNSIWEPNVLGMHNVKTGQPLPVDLSAYLSGVFSPDGQRIAVRNDKEAYILDISDSGNEVPPTLELEEFFIRAGPRRQWFRFTPDGRQLVSVAFIETSQYAIQWWDTTTGRLDDDKSRVFTMTVYDDGFMGSAISPDTQILLMGSFFGRNEVRDLITGEFIGRVDGHWGQLTGMCFSPDGKVILTGAGDRTVRLWETATLKETRRLRGHPLGISSVAWSPDGEWLATGDEGGTVRIWPADATPEQPVFRDLDEDTVVALSPDGRLIANGFEGRPEGHLVLVDATTGDPIRPPFTSKTMQGDATTQTSTRDIDFSPDGQHVAATIRHRPGPGETCVWNVRTGELLAFWNESFTQIEFSPDGNHILSVSEESLSENGNVTVWSIERGGEFEKKLELDIGTTSGEDAVFSPDGSRIISASSHPGWFGARREDAVIRIWDARDGRELTRLSDAVLNQSTIALSPDGRRLAVSVKGNLVKLFDLSTPEEEPQLLIGHQGDVRSSAFSSDGRRLVTGSADHTAMLWDVETGRAMLTLKGHTMLVDQVKFYPDGKRILTRSWDRTQRVWEVATPEEVDAWARAEEAHTDLIQVKTEEMERLKAELARKVKEVTAVSAKHPLAIKQWLMLGPIPFNDTDGAAALDQEQIPNEAGLRPRVDQKATGANVDLTWMAARQDDFRTDFRRLLSSPRTAADNVVGYAVTYIRTDTARTNLLLKVGSDDQAKIYLNGKEVYRWVEPRSWQPNQDTVTGIALQAGLNVLVFKVVNEGANWEGSVWITDADGNPVPGVSVTLDPDEDE